MFDELKRKNKERFLDDHPKNVSAKKIREQNEETYNELENVIQSLEEGVSPTIITPSTTTQEIADLSTGVYRIQGKGTYNLLVSEAVEGVTINGDKTVVAEGYDVKFVKSDNGWKVASSVKIPMQNLDDINQDINYLKEFEREFGSLTLLRTKNLFNTNDVLYDKYQPSQVQNLVNASQAQKGLWVCSNYIPIIAGEKYTISGNKNRLGVGFYNSDKQCIGYNSVNIGTVTAPADSVYMVINLTNNNTKWENVMIEKSPNPTQYEPYYVIKYENIELSEPLHNAVSITGKLNSFEIISNNIANPNLVQEKCLINDATGGILTGTSTTDLYDSFIKIPVSANTSYKALNIVGTQSLRKVAFYNSQNVYISGLDSVNNFTTPNGSAFVSFSFRNTEDKVNIGLFLSYVIDFDYFEKSIDIEIENNASTEVKNNNSLATIQDVKNLTERIEGEINFKKSGNLLEIEIDKGSYLFALEERGNLIANFNRTNFKDVNNLANTDDVAPIHIMGTTLGANHGLPYNRVTTSSAHGLINTDIGTEWFHSNGLKYYLFEIPTTTTLGFLSEPNGTREDFTFSNIPIGTITRGDKTLIISSVSGMQFYSGTLDKQIKVYTNKNKEITENGIYKADYIDVIEVYSLKNFHDVIQNLITNQGSEYPQFIGEKMVTFYNHYRFNKNGSVIISSNINPEHNLKFRDFMFNQAVRISNSGSVYYYIPNSLPIAGYDFRKPLNITFSSSVPALNVSQATWKDANNPPNRVVQYYNNTGFCFGFIKDYGVGKKLQDYTSTTFEIRNNTGKIYPHGVDSIKIGDTIQANDNYNAVMYRVFTDLSETRIGNRLSMFNFNYNEFEYIILDYSGTMFDKVVISDVFNGKKIEVIESVNTVLKTDIYNSGFFVKANYIDNETCFIVLRIK